MRFIHRKATRPGTENVASPATAGAPTASQNVDDLVIRPAGPADLKAMSRAHVDLLPTGLFPSLGERFVRRWHRTYLDSPHGVGYVVTDSTAPRDGLVGFLLGTTNQAVHTAALLADRHTMTSLAVTAASAMVRRPRAAARLLSSRALPWARQLLSRRSAEPTPTTAPQVAVIIALAVQPQWRGSGIGAQLVIRFIEQARLAGASTAELVTPIGSAGATSFYERLGWEPGPHRHTRDGEGLRAYHHHLSTPDQPH